MGNLLAILFLAICVNVVYADRVVLQKSTGKLIEYQSGEINSPIDMTDVSENEREAHVVKIKKDRIDALKNNAVSAGYAPGDIEVKEVTSQEWEAIKQEQIIKPMIEKKKQDDKDRKIKEADLCVKLNLTQEDFLTLKQVLR